MRQKTLAAVTYFSRIGEFVRDRGGGVMTVSALAAPFAIALVGFGLEAGVLYQVKRAEQTAADTAAMAGAIERGKGHPENITVAARKVAAANGFANVSPTTVTVNSPPTSGPYAGNPAAVEVKISTIRPKILPVSLLSASDGDGSATVASSAVALVEITGDACLLALDPTATNAIHNNGNASIGMQGCVMAANSSDQAAISISGTTTLTANSLWTAGNVVKSGSSNVSLESPAKTNMWALTDPYADLTITLPGSCNYTNKSVAGGAVTLSPGTYCGGLNIGANANVTLTPGTYYIDQGDLRVNGLATVKCPACTGNQGITFVLTSSGSPSNIGTVVINGGADIKLHAPANSGDFPGMLIVQDRRAPTSVTMKLNGGAQQKLSGAIYAPAQEVQWAGTADSTTYSCVEIIARLITFIGNSSIENSGCSAMGVKPVQITATKLVQ